jgi:hypothetical protein
MPTLEVSTYADLLNRDVIVPSANGGFIGVELHFFIDCMRPILERIKFDERWYLKTHPDVLEAITSNIVPDAHDHYVRHGFFEHRMPYQITVNEKWYLREYADVRDAIARSQFPSGQAHFETKGFREGRIPYASFKLETRD